MVEPDPVRVRKLCASRPEFGPGFLVFLPCSILSPFPLALQLALPVGAFCIELLHIYTAILLQSFHCPLPCLQGVNGCQLQTARARFGTMYVYAQGRAPLRV